MILEVGKRYRVTFQLPSQRKPRETEAVFTGVSKDTAFVFKVGEQELRLRRTWMVDATRI